MGGAYETKVNPVAKQVVRARFSARFVPAMAAVVSDLPFSGDAYRGIQIEPVDDGVILLATDGLIMVWVFEPGAMATAPLALDCDDRMIAACTPPVLPKPFDANGDEYDIYPPSWLTPKEVSIIADTEGLARSRHQVFPRINHMNLVMVFAGDFPQGMNVDADDAPTLYISGGAYHGITQVIDRKPINWRTILPTTDPVPTPEILIDARLLAKLVPFGNAARMRFYGDGKGVLIDFKDEPNAHAMVMPIVPTKVGEQSAG